MDNKTPGEFYKLLMNLFIPSVHLIQNWYLKYLAGNQQQFNTAYFRECKMQITPLSCC